MVSYPKDWKLETIGEIFNTITDYVAAGSFKDLSENVKYYNSPNYAQLIRTRDIKTKFKNRDFIFINKQAYDYLWRVHFDDTKIIMPNIGNCGEVYFVEIDKLPHERCVLGPNAIMLFDTDNDMKFIYYALQRNDFQKDLKDIISPSGQTKFNKTDLSKINIRIPADIREQKAIAETLMTFDRHIENLERLIEKKKMIRDGAVEDLVSGKRRLAGFNGEWKKSKLEDICVENGLVRGPFGGSLKKEYFVSKGYKVYEQKNAIYGNVNIGSYYIDDRKFEELKRFELNKDDFIVSCSGTIGKIYRMPCNFEKGIINQALLKIILDSAKCNLVFFNTYFKWQKFQMKIIDDTQGGAMKNLVGMDKFKRTMLYIPLSLLEQQAIADILTAMDKEIADLEEEKEKYMALKAGAMDDLLTGKIRLA